MSPKEAEEIVRQLGRTAQARGMKTLPRQRKVHPDYGGGSVIEQIEICSCEGRRGPKGGICGNCGGAIPE